MIRFYSPDIEHSRALPEEESAHAIRVLRKRVGDIIEVIDGKGFLYECEILTEHSKHVSLEVINKTYLGKTWQPAITLAVAPTKNIDRISWLIEKAVEIGVDRIVPLLCGRSERKVVKCERLRKIAVSAMKQSLKAELPKITDIVNFSQFINSDTSTIRCFGYCDKDMTRTSFVDLYKPNESVTIMIGPEGDFTPEEVQMAISAGWKAVTFGNNRLRTETAALYALQSVHIINEMNNLHKCNIQNQ